MQIIEQVANDLEKATYAKGSKITKKQLKKIYVDYFNSMEDNDIRKQVFSVPPDEMISKLHKILMNDYKLGKI